MNYKITIIKEVGNAKITTTCETDDYLRASELMRLMRADRPDPAPLLAAIKRAADWFEAARRKGAVISLPSLVEEHHALIETLEDWDK